MDHRPALTSLPHALLGATALLVCATAAASPGDLDTTFNAAGTALDPYGSGFSEGLAVTVQADGLIVVAGEINGDFALVRYQSDGTLDSANFNPSSTRAGTVTQHIGVGASAANAVTIQQGGAILAAGQSLDNNNRQNFTLARFSSDGGLDTSFNAGDVDAGTITTAIGTGDSAAYALGLQVDGSILAAGYATEGATQNFAVARYTSGGQLDTSFNPEGIVPGAIDNAVGSYASAAYGLAVQTDGRIVVAGAATGGPQNEFALARYNANGTLDSTFNPNGSGATSPGTLATAVGAGGSSAYGVTLQPDGKIVAVGRANDGTADGFAVARYNGDGTLDTGFNAGGPQPGTVITPIGTGRVLARAVVLQPDGKIVAAGYAFNGATQVLALARYNGDGTLDTGFNAAGPAPGTLTTPLGSGNATATALALQTDGKIVTAGTAHSSTGPVMAVARYVASDTPWDLTPDAFHFTDVKTAVQPGSVQTSNMITISGLGPGVSVPVTVTDGEYAKNGSGIYTVQVGWAADGDQFNVRQTAVLGQINTTLTVGGMMAANNPVAILGTTTADAFSSVSISGGGTGSGSLTPPSLLCLLLAWGVSRWWRPRGGGRTAPQSSPAPISPTTPLFGPGKMDSNPGRSRSRWAKMNAAADQT